VSSKFVKKLKKDLKKSPGKAAVLALVSVVAIWFWAPLVTGMFGGTSKPVATPAVSPPPAATTTNAVAGPTPLQPTTDWKRIAEAIDKDPRMKPAAKLVLARDPFCPIEPEHTKEVVEDAKPELQPIALDVAPAEAGLVLSGTIVGSHRSVARLNGKSYSAGDLVKAPAAEVPLSYRIVNIGGRSVTLALGDKQYELKMSRRQLADTADVGDGSQDTVSSDSPDFDPSMLEQLN
jgi:hypothetical protein